jgi:hypothetical protein
MVFRLISKKLVILKTCLFLMYFLIVPTSILNSFFALISVGKFISRFVWTLTTLIGLLISR